MLVFKKLIFALPFLLVLTIFTQQINLNLQNPSLLFSFDLTTLYSLLFLTSLLLISCFLFVVFCTLAYNWEIILPVIFLGSTLPFFSTDPLYSLLLTTGFFISFLITFFHISQKLKTYLTFEPTSLLIPSAKLLATLLILVSSLAFYLTAQNYFEKQEISQILKPIVDLSLKMALSQNQINSTTAQSEVDTGVQLPKISPEQIAYLKENPELLEQNGITLEMLEQIERASQNPPQAEAGETKTSPIEAMVRAQLETQLNESISPYIQYLPFIFALLFFITLQPLASLLSLLLYPLTLSIFYILEKTGFTRFDKEMREVKKLVV